MERAWEVFKVESAHQRCSFVLGWQKQCSCSPENRTAGSWLQNPPLLSESQEGWGGAAPAPLMILWMWRGLGEGSLYKREGFPLSFYSWKRKKDLSLCKCQYVWDIEWSRQRVNTASLGKHTVLQFFPQPNRLKWQTWTFFFFSSKASQGTKSKASFLDAFKWVMARTAPSHLDPDLGSSQLAQGCD